MICQECKEEVSPAEKHTYQDCLLHKEKLRMVELARLEIKVKDLNK